MWCAASASAAHIEVSGFATAQKKPVVSQFAAAFIKLIAIDRNLFILLILSMQFFISSRIVFDARDLCIVKWKYFGTTDFDLLRYFRR